MWRGLLTLQNKSKFCTENRYKMLEANLGWMHLNLHGLLGCHLVSGPKSIAMKSRYVHSGQVLQHSFHEKKKDLMRVC